MALDNIYHYRFKRKKYCTGILYITHTHCEQGHSLVSVCVEIEYSWVWSNDERVYSSCLVFLMHIDLKHLLEGKNSNMVWLGCDGSVVIPRPCLRCFLALEENRSLREGFCQSIVGRSDNILQSAQLIISCRAKLDCYRGEETLTGGYVDLT